MKMLRIWLLTVVGILFLGGCPNPEKTPEIDVSIEDATPSPDRDHGYHLRISTPSKETINLKEPWDAYECNVEWFDGREWCSLACMEPGHGLVVPLSCTNVYRMETLFQAPDFLRFVKEPEKRKWRIHFHCMVPRSRSRESSVFEWMSPPLDGKVREPDVLFEIVDVLSGDSNIAARVHYRIENREPVPLWFSPDRAFGRGNEEQDEFPFAPPITNSVRCIPPNETAEDVLFARSVPEQFRIKMAVTLDPRLVGELYLPAASSFSLFPHVCNTILSDEYDGAGK